VSNKDAIFPLKKSRFHTEGEVGEGFPAFLAEAAMKLMKSGWDGRNKSM
jgi:hypothetical protein